jgi:hypothetical protein
MFKTTGPTGFHITFDNGWTVSVQFGGGTYSDNKQEDPFSSDNKESSTAEIAAWNKDGWYEFETENDNVRGYVSANDVLEFMNMIANKEK